MIETTTNPGASSDVTSALTAPNSILRLVRASELRARSLMTGLEDVTAQRINLGFVAVTYSGICRLGTSRGRAAVASTLRDVVTARRFAAWAFVWIALETAAPAQQSFTDDAQRNVPLPGEITRVFAAGAPAEVLLYTLVPDMLVGRNHALSPAALELTPPEYRNPVAVTNLPERDDPRYDTELLALKPDVYVDYGTIDEDYVGALEAISARTHIPALILDGRLANIPAVYRRLGAALGVPERGERLAVEATRLLEKYRDALRSPPVRVYLACSQNGMTPCISGHSFGEAAAWLGAVNTAGTVGTAPRRPLTLEEIRAFDPDVIVAASRGAAATLRADPAWQQLPAVAAGRVYAPPDVPFGWGPRPPSVNRLAGLIWMAYVLPGHTFDDAFFADIEAFFETFYHLKPSREQLRSLVVE